MFGKLDRTLNPTSCILKLSALLLVVVQAGLANAQLSATDRQELQQLGYSSVDIQQFGTVLIAPQYMYYKKWDDCVGNVASLSLRSNKTAAESSEIAFMECKDDEALAKSFVAKAIGLSKADRVMAIARAVDEAHIRATYGHLHPPLPPGTFAAINNWRVIKVKTGACFAIKKGVDSDEPDTMDFILDNPNQVKVDFIHLGPLSDIINDNEGVTTLSLGITEWHGMSPQEMGTFQFQHTVDGKLTVLSATMSEGQVADLGNVTSLNIDGSHWSVNITGFDEVWAALKRCAA